MKYLLTIFLFLTSLTNLYASWIEKEGCYVGISTGANKIKSYANLNSKFGCQGSISVGYRLAPVRIEAELSYQQTCIRGKSQIDFLGYFPGYRGEARSYSCFANMLVDFNHIGFKPYMGNFSPYLGFGLGYTRFDLREDNTSSFTLKARGLCWQAIAGISYPLNDHIEIGIEYRFQEKYLRSHSTGLALKYLF